MCLYVCLCTDYQSDSDSFNPTLWEEQRQQRMTVAFDFEDKKEEEDNSGKVKVSSLHKCVEHVGKKTFHGFFKNFGDLNKFVSIHLKLFLLKKIHLQFEMCFQETCNSFHIAFMFPSHL